MLRALLVFGLAALSTTITQAQTVSYTVGGLRVDVFKSNPCEGSNNGYLQFSIISTSDGLPAQLQVIVGPPNLFVPQTIPVGGSYIFNPAETLPVEDYEFVVADNTGTDVVTVFGATSSLKLIALPDIVVSDDPSTNLTNSSCATPNGQIAVSIAGGSKTLVGGGSFTYTWTTTNGLSGFPVTGTTDGNSVLDLATLAGRSGLPGGDYTLVVEDNYSKCSDTRSFTITDPQPALQTITNGGPQAVCQGTGAVIQLSGSEVGITYEVLVNGSFSGISQVGTGSPMTINVPAGTFTNGQVLVVRAVLGACSPRIMSGFITMTVNPLPVPALSGNNPVCAGSTGNVYTTDAGMTNYIWSVTGGAITAGGTATSNTVTVTWGAAGTGSISVNYTTAAGCTATTPTVSNITISPVPTPTLSGPATRCVGSTGAVYTTEAGQSNYVWTVSAGGTITAGGTATSNTVTVTWNAAGAQTVSVNYQNAASCAAPAPTVYNVNVTPLPIPALGGNLTACLNDAGVVYTTDAGMTGYVWSVVGGTITAGGTATDNTVTVTWGTLAGAHTVSVNYTNPAGCTATAPTSVNVTVNALPTPTLGGPASICAASAGHVYTTEAGQSNYVWTVSAGGTITAGGNATSNTVTVTWSTAGPQTVSVNYDNAAGCDAMTATVYNVTVNPQPVPVISGPAAVCQGATSNIYSTAAGQTGYVWVVTGGTVTAGGTATSNTVTVTWPAAGAGSVSVSYTDANGCTPAAPTVYNVNISPLPTPALGGNVNACTATSNVYTTDAGQSNYVWTVSAGGTITAGGTSTSNTVTVTWNAAGAQTVTVNYDNAAGCDATTATVLNVTVNARPTPSLAGSTAVCVGATGIVYTTDAGQANYVWTVSSGGTVTAGGSATDNTITITWGTAGPQTVSVNYTNAAGCAASTATVRNVSVNALPVPALAGLTAACVGATGVVYTTDAGMTSYVWTVSAGGTITAGGTATSNTVTVTWGTTGPQTVTVNYTDANGCTATAATTLNVAVNPVPTPSLSGSASECVGATGVVYTTDAGQSNYVWTVSAGGTITAGGTATDNSVTVTWTAAGPQTVTVNYQNASGCPATAATVLNVAVNALPAPTITGSASECLGATNVVYSTQPGQFNYVWTVSAGGTITAGGTATDNTVTVTWTTSGPQTVTVNYNNAAGCAATTPTVRNVVVHPLPTPVLAGPLTPCVGATGIAYTTTAGQANYVWTVSAGGTITAGGTSTSNTVTVNWTGSGAQTVSVNYTDTNGCTAATPTTLNINVIASPTPTITGPTAVCANTPGNVYTTEAGMTGYVWTVSAGGTITAGGTATDNTITITWAAAGARTVRVNYQNGAGCAAPTATTLNVTVNPRPTITIAGSNNVCLGASVTYSTQTPRTNYQWTVSAGGTITAGGTATDNTVTVTWNTAGPQSVSVNYAITATGCTAPAPVTRAVTVNPLPTPSLTGLTTPCVGATNVTYTTDTGMTNYVWNVSAGGTITAGGTSTSNTVTVTWNSAGPQTVSVNYTNATNCTAATATILNVNVTAVPTPALAGPSPVCVGTTGAVYTTDAGQANYVWVVSAGGTVTAGGTAADNTVTVTWGVSGAQTVSVNYDNTSGCPATSPTVLNVQVDALPVPTITGGSATECEGASVTYTTEAGQANYVWTVSAGGTITAGGTATSNTVTVTWGTAGAQTVSVNYDNAAGCDAPAATVRNVQVDPAPTSAVLSGTATICAGNSTNLVVTITGGTGPYTITIDNGVGTINNYISGTAIPVSPAANTTYSLVGNVTDASGCTVAGTGTATITVGPTITSAVLSGTNTICQGTSTDLVVTITGGTGPYSITIDNGVGTINNYVSGTPIPVSPGTTTSYQLVGTVSDAAGCTVAGTGVADITVNPAVTSAVLSGTAGICASGSADLIVTIAGGTGPYTITIDNGVGTINNYVSGTPIPVSPATTTTYSLVGNVTDATGCFVAGTGSATITVSPGMTSAMLSLDGAATICAGNTTTLKVTITGGTGPYTVTINNGVGTINNYLSDAPITVSPAGTVSYSLVGNVVDAAGCTVVGAGTADVTVNPSPDATFTGLAGPYCTNDGPVTLTPNIAGGTFSGPGVAGNSFDPVAAGTGTHAIQYQITVAGCTSTTTQTVDVNPAPNAAINAAGPFCANDPATTLTAATAGGTWSGVGITDAALGTFNPAVAGPGVKNITYQVTVGGCTATATRAITVFAAPNATISPAGPFCTTDAAVTLTAVSGGGLWSGAGITDPVLGTFDPATAGAGTHTITYSVTLGTCTDTKTTSIVVGTQPNATITPAGPLCTADAAITLTAVTPGGTWSGTGITDAAAGIFDPATAGPGTHTITYTITIGGCSDTETTSIQVNPSPDATITAAGPFCTTDAAVNLTAATAGGTWSGTGITDPVLGTFDPATAGAGSHVITYTISTGSCSDTDNITIGVSTPPDATITPVGPFCTNDAAVTLAAVTAGGTWSGTGITDAAAGIFDPAVAGAGTHTITYTITIGGCSDTETTSIQVDPAPDATITAAGPFCTLDAAVNLVAATTGGIWSGPGITDAAAGTFDPATAGAGTHTITYTITSGVCTDTDNIQITVAPPPDATITAAGPFCTGDAAVNLVAATTGGTWSGPGITDAAAGTFDPAVAGPGTHTITYAITIGGCSDTKTTNIDVNQTPDATITAAGPFCTLDAAVNLVAATTGGTWSGTGITDAVSGTFDPATAGAGDHVITYTLTTAGCTDTDNITIRVATPPDATIAAAGPFCTSDAAVTLMAATTGGTWSGTGITDAVAGTFDPSAAGAGTHTITYTITIGGCSDTKTTSITVNQGADATINAAGPFCVLDAAVTLTAATGGGTWSGPGITDAAAGTFDPATAGAGNHNITYTIVNGACTDTDNITITVSPQPNATITGAGPFCTTDSPVTLTAVTPGGTWSGPGITDAAAGTFSPAVAGAGTHTITYTITIGSCSDTKTTSIVVNSGTTAAINPAGPFCPTSTPVTLTANVPGGTWAGPGVNPTTGLFTPATAGVGNHTITYTVGGTCGSVASTVIVVNAACGGLNCFAFTITPNLALTKRPSCSDRDDGVIALEISTVSGGNIIVQLIAPDGTTITQVNPGGLFIFPDLSPADYQYKLLDAAGNVCQQPYSLPVQTTVDASASAFVDVTCSGEPTGQAMLDASGSSTGNYFYSIDGSTWTQFVPHNVITNLPPNGTYGIFVGESTNDACAAVVNVTINNKFSVISATFDIDDATCNGNDGALTVQATGGSGNYQYALDGVTFQTSPSFTGLSGGGGTVTIKDDSGCSNDVPFMITFPGYIAYDPPIVQQATCDNNGESGAITINISGTPAPGQYQVALSQDQFNEPPASEYLNYSEPSVTFPDLAAGDYYIYIKSATASCPTRTEKITIDGIYAINFDMAQGCSSGIAPNIDKPYLLLTNITGNKDPLASKLIVSVRRAKTNDVFQQVAQVSLSETTTLLLDETFAFMQLYGAEYEIQLSQLDIFSAFCEVKTNFLYTVPFQLFATTGVSSRSYPDIASGTMQVIRFSGGIAPYDVRIELDSAASFAFPSYATNFEEVGANSNLDFAKMYKNIPAGRYKVQVVDSVGCSIEFNGRVPLDTDIYIPNIFTPNEDGTNDVFFIRNLPTPGAKLVITNRWGKEVYSSNDYQNDWRGEGVADGVYFYRLKGTDSESKPVSGWIEILRGQKP